MTEGENCKITILFELRGNKHVYYYDNKDDYILDCLVIKEIKETPPNTHMNF